MFLARLSDKIEFPPVHLARADGLLCFGGDLSAKRLICAYENGIFPWFSENEPLLWWSPDPRLVLFPRDLHISRSLKKKIRKKPFRITIDQAFEQTIQACAGARQNQSQETWIVPEMIEAYVNLHQMGLAHSIETWQGSRLVGGLYGVSIGGSFFGESMFSIESDASKIALVSLCGLLQKYRFDLIDCQVTTKHLMGMGAVEIPRSVFTKEIRSSIQREIDPDIWIQTIV